MLLQALKSRSIRWAILGVLIGAIEVNWGFITNTLSPHIGAHAMGWVTILFAVGAGFYRVITTMPLDKK